MDHFLHPWEATIISKLKSLTKKKKIKLVTSRMLPSATHRVTLEGRPAPAPEPEAPRHKASAATAVRWGRAQAGLCSTRSPGPSSGFSRRPRACTRARPCRACALAPESSSCPVPPLQPPQAPLDRIKLPSCEGAGHAGRAGGPQALSSGHKDAAQKHTGLCTQPPNRNLGSQRHVACLWSRETGEPVPDSNRWLTALFLSPWVHTASEHVALRQVTRHVTQYSTKEGRPKTINEKGSHPCHPVV